MRVKFLYAAEMTLPDLYRFSIREGSVCRVRGSWTHDGYKWLAVELVPGTAPIAMIYDSDDMQLMRDALTFADCQDILNAHFRDKTTRRGHDEHYFYFVTDWGSDPLYHAIDKKTGDYRNKRRSGNDFARCPVHGPALEKKFKEVLGL